MLLGVYYPGKAWPARVPDYTGIVIVLPGFPRLEADVYALLELECGVHVGPSEMNSDTFTVDDLSFEVHGRRPVT